MLKTDDLHRLEIIETCSISADDGFDELLGLLNGGDEECSNTLLSDEKNKWNIYKRLARKVANAWEGFDPDRAKKIRQCSSEVYSVVAGERRRVLNALRCKDPLCPICAWRQSLMLGVKLQRELERLDMPVAHLVLTLKNVPCVEGTVDRLWLAWRKLSRRKFFKDMVAGCYVSLEWTYNYQTDEWHPHLHILTVLTHDFSDSDLDRVKRRIIEKVWFDITGDSYVCFWERRSIDKSDNMYKSQGVSEVTKYVSNAIVGAVVRPDLLRALGAEIYGRRLRSSSGVLKGFLSRLEEEEEGGVEVDLLGDFIQVEEVDKFERWVWKPGEGYVLVEEFKPGDKMFSIMMNSLMKKLKRGGLGG